MKSYLLYLPDTEELEAERKIDGALCGTRCIDNAFSPFADSYLFRSSLDQEDVAAKLCALFATDEDDDPAFVLLEVSGGDFGGFHQHGTKSRLKLFFAA
jgi:hypothetical protein